MSVKKKENSAPVTWADIHAKIRRAGAALEVQGVESPAQQRELLERRARDLARKYETPVLQKRLELVEFSLADEHYGLECRFVREVYPLKNLTPIPGTPAFIMGIVNVRGEIISVVDLKQFFQLPARGLSDLNRVIILHYKDEQCDMEFGILAEEVLGTLLLPEVDLQPPLPTLTGIRADYLKGIGKNRLVVLDAMRLLTDKKMKVHQEVDG